MPSHKRDYEDREEGEMVDEDDDDGGDHERSAVSRKRYRSESASEESDDSSHAHKRKKVKKEKKHKKSSKKRKKEKKEKRSEHSHRSSRHRRENVESNSGVIDVDKNDDDDDDAATDREDACSTPELPEMEEEIELEKEPSANAVKSSSPPSSSSRKPQGKLVEADETSKKERRRRSRSPAARSHTRSAPKHSEGSLDKPPKPSQSRRHEPEEAEPESSKAVLSLSVEETNKLRAKLGMAPLKVNGTETSKAKDASEEIERQRKEELAAKEGGTLIAESTHSLEVHRPPKNMREKTLAEKLRERIAQRKQKREHEVKMALVKKLGEASDDEDNATSWVERQKRVQQEKEAAAKRQKMLDDLDDEFGVASIVEEESKKERDSQYRRNNLAGLKVEHSAEKFAEGRSVILTLKDSNILDEEDEDTLVNVNIVDDERATKKIDEARKAKVGYNAYDQEDVDDMTGEVRKKNMLAKYDEEIDGAQKSSFRIGDSGEYNEEAQLQRERDRVRQKLAAKRTTESLETAPQRIASDYYTHEEVLQFKKPKKKKKVKSTRKSMLKADDLLAMDGTNPLPDSFGSRNRAKAKAEREETPSASNRGALPMDVDEEEGFSLKIEQGSDNVKMEPLEDDNLDFQDVLKRAKKLRARKGAAADLADQLLAESRTANIKKEADDHEDASGSAFIATFDDDAEAQSRIILNETAEFCRNLGARSLSGGDEFWRSSVPGPSGYGAAESGGGAEVSRDLLEFEDSLKSRSTRQYEELRQERGKWSKVGDPDGENSSDDGENMDVSDNDDDDGEQTKKATILDEEPDLQQGVASAIKLAANKGYWEKDENKSGGTKLSHLLAQNYTIEDKLKMREDDRSNRRERYSGGPSQPFSEKSGYNPNVKLEYIDDSGRLLNQKEAFRYLSHKFHGKGSGKMKTEKRMKKVMEEGLMKNMSSTDTPLQTLEKLKKRQKECATPYLVLTGNKINPQDLKK